MDTSPVKSISSRPTLGRTADEVWRGWRSLIGLKIKPGEIVVGWFPGEGEYCWGVDGKLERVFSDPRRGTSSTAPALPKEEDRLFDLIKAGSFQIELRKIVGATGAYPRVGGGKVVAVLHQATGQPIPEND